jgi:hypothetical protein
VSAPGILDEPVMVKELSADVTPLCKQEFPLNIPPEPQLNEYKVKCTLFEE